MPHREKRLHPHRIEKFWYQDAGFTAIPRGYRPPRRDPDPEEVDLEMRTKWDEYFREHRSA